MELTVLGRSGRYPEKNGGTSAYLLRNDNVTLLLDMGSGAIAKFQNYIGIEDIDAILFSHLHGDHMADFLPFNYMVAFLGKRITKPIDVYLPREPQSVVDSMVSNSTKLNFNYIEDREVIRVGDIEIEFMATRHPVMCYAMKIHDSKSNTLLYTADTTMFNGIETLFDGVDVVLGDACVLKSEWTDKSPHLSVYDLARMSKDSGARLILTHLPDNEADIEAVLSEAKSVNVNSEVALVGKTYTI